MPGGGLLLDTPGMRELQILDEDGLDTVFGDIAALAGRCRFRDCRHDTEPGCAVKEAVASGKLDADRFEHYRKLEREAGPTSPPRRAPAAGRAGVGQLSDESLIAQMEGRQALGEGTPCY
jgi:ribosome biogenesis GTPase